MKSIVYGLIAAAITWGIIFSVGRIRPVADLKKNPDNKITKKRVEEQMVVVYVMSTFAALLGGFMVYYWTEGERR